MRYSRIISLGVEATLIWSAAAQSATWANNQFNTSICYWKNPRVALLHDTIYLDGGLLTFAAGLKDGQVTTGVAVVNKDNYILRYNLSESFSPETNVTGILLDNRIPGITINPSYVDGALLGNDDEFFLYGGYYLAYSQVQDPSPKAISGYQGYSYSQDKPSWSPGFVPEQLGADVNSFIAYGGAANAPSERLSFYFSGLTSPQHGPMTSAKKMTDFNISDTLITLDSSTQNYEKWSNDTLHGKGSMKGRASSEMVWVPVGKRGILVVLGGVLYPPWAEKNQNLTDQSVKQSPDFMKSIDIYDVGNKTWYSQKTNGDGPGALIGGCAVAAHASDLSSYNIYYYGGYDGANELSPRQDTVWVLSLPSFTWIKLNEGDTDHARADHKCVLPYPDQMMALGGMPTQTGGTAKCVENPVTIFNITSGEWMKSYDPTRHGEYGVPEKVQKAIGGTASGGATATKPQPDGWDNGGLESVFSTKYDMEKIKTYYPYPPASTSDHPPTPSDKAKNNNGGSGLPSWVAPVLGVVLGLIFVTGIIVLFCLYRRRKIFKSQRNSTSEVGSEEAGKRILSWIRGQPTDKAPTVTTSEDIPVSPGMTEARTYASTPSVYPPYSRYEMPDTQLAELGDTSPPAELHDTGLSPMDIIQKHTHIGNNRSRVNSDLSNSSRSAFATDRASAVSQPSAGSPGTPRIDSPALPLGSHPMGRRDSFSSIQKDEDISPRPVSTADDPPVSPPVVSPPTADEAHGSDYLTAKSVPATSRRSVFREHDDDDDDNAHVGDNSDLVPAHLDISSAKNPEMSG